jgi:ribonuclease J
VLPYIDGPIYGTKLTLGLLAAKLDAHAPDARARLVEVRPRERYEAGAFTLEFLRVTHSMPDCVAVAIHTPAGIALHTGDFKVDQTPLDGQPMDLHRFAELGSQGVLVMLGDSTNIERKGFSGSERDVMDGFEEIYTSARGRIVVALFSSSLYRMQILVDLADQFDRKVAFVGRGVIENSQIAQRLGYLRVPPGVQIRDTEVREYPQQDVVCICTGSQGEPQAALPRIAIDDHRHVKLDMDDVVVFSAREIPGNEKAIGRVMNHVAKRGADIVHDGIRHIHVSGHGSEEELKMMLSLVRPQFFVPIHGEYRQLARHARVARMVSPATRVVLAENGDVVRIDEEGARVTEKVAAGRILIDGTRSGEVGDEVLRDRRHLAGDGLVVPVVAISRQSGTLEETPDVITRGFVLDARTEALLKEIPGLVGSAIESASVEERTDPGLIKEKIRVDLQRFFRKRSGLRPFVLPVVMEI